MDYQDQVEAAFVSKLWPLIHSWQRGRGSVDADRLGSMWGGGFLCGGVVAFLMMNTVPFWMVTVGFITVNIVVWKLFLSQFYREYNEWMEGSAESVKLAEIELQRRKREGISLSRLLP